MKPQPLATGRVYKKPSNAVTAKKIITLLYKYKLCQNKEAETDKKQEQVNKILRMESSNAKNYINNYIFLLKIYLQKRDLAYAYYFNLVETIIRH